MHWVRCLRHGLRGGVSFAAFAAWADGDGRASFTPPLPFPASCSMLWLRCLRHGLRGGVTCAAFAAWADGDGRPSFTSPLPFPASCSAIRLVLPYVSVDCSASVSRRGGLFVVPRVLIGSAMVGADAHMKAW